MSVRVEGGVLDSAKSSKILQNQSSIPAFSHTQVSKSEVYLPYMPWMVEQKINKECNMTIMAHS